MCILIISLLFEKYPIVYWLVVFYSHKNNDASNYSSKTKTKIWMNWSIVMKNRWYFLWNGDIINFMNYRMKTFLTTKISFTYNILFMIQTPKFERKVQWITNENLTVRLTDVLLSYSVHLLKCKIVTCRHTLVEDFKKKVRLVMCNKSKLKEIILIYVTEHMNECIKKSNLHSYIG
jgi:hypothetical protein